jgi:hypothetical protein
MSIDKLKKENEALKELIVNLFPLRPKSTTRRVTRVVMARIWRV